MAIGWIRRLILGGAICGIALLMPHVALAEAQYGGGVYGGCAVGEDCVVEPTTVSTPSGLDFSVNLTDGQAIVSSGYTVVITPSNASAAIAQVDIYINDQLVATVTPEPTGAATWHWDPVLQPGTKVKVVVTATDGQTASRSYTVSITDDTVAAPTADASNNAGAAAATAADGGNSPVQLVRRLINALPPPVARSIPYLLFLILLANLVLVLLQLWRELQEYGLAKRLLQRQREIANDKRVLLQLLSHYLRTPMTLVVGGVDMLPTAQQTTVGALRQSLSTKVEQLIAQASEIVPSVPTTQAQTDPVSIHFWRRPAMFLPIVLVGGLVATFDYLAQGATRFSVSQTNMITQLLVFVTLVLLTYFSFRSMQLHRRDTRELERVAQAEEAVAQADDAVVSSSAILLQQDITRLGDTVATLPAGDGTKYIANGYKGLKALLDKVQLAVSLRGAQSTDPVVQLPLRQLLGDAAAVVATAATARQMTLPQGDDASVTTRSPELLGKVVTSLLDNAVAYGTAGTAVEAAHTVTPQGNRLIITDHGAGIPESRLHDLFLPFQKLEGAYTFNHEGMGLSLYLDRLIMKYLGGSISVETPADGGTSIVLELPTAA